MNPAVRLLGRLLQPVASASRALRSSPGLTIIGWHRIDGISQGLSIGVDDFKRHLDEIEEWGAQVLPLERAVADLQAGTLPDRAVVLTFDDGYASVIETAWPLLCERHMPATSFVVSGAWDGKRRYPWDLDEPEHDRLRLSRPDEIADAARSGLDIGSHTVSHPWLPRLDPVDLERELVESRAAVSELIGRPVTSLAYPTGGWDSSVRAAAADAGYTIGITVDRGLNTNRTPQLSLRRSFAPSDAADLRIALDGGYSVLRPLDSVRSRQGPAW